VKGRPTIRIAGAFFALSAIIELVSMGVQVPLLGALRGGLTAAVYHGAFAALLLTIGVGLWKTAPWGARAVYLGTVVYSLDRFRYLLDRPGRESELLHQLGSYPEIVETFGVDLLLRLGTLMALLFVGCWWGFAVYVYVRRAVFTGAPVPGSADARDFPLHLS